MKISLNWLKEFIKISENPQKIEAILTETGLEVDEVIDNSVDGINYYLKHGIIETMNNFNKRNNNGE